jgi:hypothetical protein
VGSRLLTHNLLHTNYNTTDVVQESWAHNLLHTNYNTTDVVQESWTHNLLHTNYNTRLLNHISGVIVSVQ